MDELIQEGGQRLCVNRTTLVPPFLPHGGVYNFSTFFALLGEINLKYRSYESIFGKLVRFGSQGRCLLGNVHEFAYFAMTSG